MNFGTRTCVIKWRKLKAGLFQCSTTWAHIFMQTNLRQNRAHCVLAGLILWNLCFSVFPCGCCLSGRFCVAGRALVIHIKWLFNVPNSIAWQYWGMWGRWMAISVSDGGNRDEAWGLLPQIFHRGVKLKREGKNPGKQFMFVTWFCLAGAAFPYQPLAVLPQFFLHCLSPRL